MKIPTRIFGHLIASASLLILSTTAARAENRVVAYVPNWIELETFSKTIDYPKLTHINIAFENPVDEAGNLSFSSKNDGLIRLARAAKVKVLMSIGGGSASGNKELMARYALLLAEPKRAEFARKLGVYLKDHQLDGLDVDIEGPSITADYGPFIDELAKVLKPQGMLLTAALSEGYGGSSVPVSALKQLDFLNIMAYDATGYWNPEKAGQHSSLEFARRCVDYWTRRGVEKSKAVLGVPFYGYGFGKAARKSQGYSYSEILELHPGAEQKDEAGETIFYNGIPTIEAKCRLVTERELGGIMIWSLDNDGVGEKSLLSAIDRGLKAAKK